MSVITDSSHNNIPETTTMKSRLTSFAFTVLIAFSGTAAKADISVCVNNANGKARFSTKCSAKETQQFLSSTGEAKSNGVRVISKKFHIPAGTIPGYGNINDSSWSPNYVVKLSCDPSEFMVDTILISLDNNYGIDRGGYCFKEDLKSLSDVSPDTSSRRAYCGLPGYNNVGSTMGPTKKPFDIYMESDCIKR